MKRLSLLLMTVLLTFGLSASNADLFKVDDEKLNEEFAKLNQIESIVSNSEDASYGSILASHPDLVKGVDLKSEISSGTLGLAGEPPLGIPSFVWGFCMWTAGLAIVYFITEDTDETKKALWGCLASTALYFLVWLALAILGSGSAWYYFI